MKEVMVGWYTEIQCPHCNHVHKNMDSEDVPWREDETFEKQCRVCDKKFEITANLRYSWNCKEIEE